MKVYLADFFAHKDRIKQRVKELEDLGIEVVSSWHREYAPSSVKTNDVNPITLVRTARRDLDEIKKCDVFILFAPSLIDMKALRLDQLARGGRHVEFGIALVLKKKIFVCGERENVFHSLIPNKYIFSTWDQIMKFLSRGETL